MQPIATQYFSADMSTAFPEGQIIPAGQCTYGNITFAPGTALVNQPAYDVSGVFVLNFNDPSFDGPKDVTFSSTVIPKQVGPLINSMARFAYSGCYQDSKCGPHRNQRCLLRNFATAMNNVESCIQTCLSNGYSIAATQYHTECCKFF